MLKFRIIVFLLICSGKLVAQLDSLQYLNVVNLQSITLNKYSKGFKVNTLNDSIIIQNPESFSTLLRFNSPIYIKEYGAGGTSSASFRGTNASNTAVVWNGININSINNGQSEFNSINVSLFESIDIRSGGGSIEYGSGAVGGTIHLNDQLKFGKHLTNQVVSSYGSYNTLHSLYKFSYGSERTAVKVGLAYNESENDYKWLSYNVKNENGAYKNTDFSISLAQKLGKFSKLSFYSSKYTGDRQFSGMLPNPSAAKEKYKDLSFRNLVDFQYHKNEFTHALKIAYLTQEYQYFANKNNDTHTFGSSKRFISKYDFNYKINANSNIQSYYEFESILGDTDQMAQRRRNQFSQSLIYNHYIPNIVALNFKLRQDVNFDYDIPLVYALGAEFTTSKNTFVRLNGSKNYRVPTYNDLFWPGSGNENLIPESSLQGEIGFVYKANGLKVDVGGFYIDSKDKIVWQPDEDKPGIWVPLNVDAVVNKGIELTVDYKRTVEKHFFDVRFNYSYTVSEDKLTKKMLPYVPKHLMNASFGYTFKRINAFYQHLFNGKIFTSEDNISLYSVPYFNVGNVGLTYTVIQQKEKTLGVGVKVNNVFNEVYQVLPSRPMPNRNMNININYKF